MTGRKQPTNSFSLDTSNGLQLELIHTIEVARFYFIPQKRHRGEAEFDKTVTNRTIVNLTGKYE